MRENIENILNQIPELVATYGMKVLLAFLVFYIGKWLAKKVSVLLGKAMHARGIDATVANFTKNISYYAMFTMVVVAALSQLGIQTASFVAIIGAAGLAVGLALQGSLANFAAGVLLILFRPFKSGDFVEAGGTAGVVKEISIFSTTLMTGDNKKVIVANGAVFGGNITNYSAEATRRVDLVVGVGYSADLAKTKTVLKSVIEAEERVLKDKDVTIAVSELADSSVNFVVRVWVNTGDYWPTRFTLLENIKMTLDENDIEIPFPQMDVHLTQQAG